MTERITESAAARELRAGFRQLRFEPELEAEFRSTRMVTARRQIRYHLLLAAALIAAFAVMDRWLLGDSSQLVPDVLRFGVLVPLIAVAIASTYAHAYTRLYPVLMQIVAPIAGICVVLIETRAARVGVELVFATLVITTIYLYFLVGMLFHAALRSNLIVLAVYVAVAWAADLEGRQLAYSVMVLALANAVGAVVAYNLEKANRVSFLEAKLLGEMVARDGLTGIYNRRMFDERLAELWDQAVREQTPIAMLLIDIDHFKLFNDCYGHQAGDETLRRVAVTLDRFARRPLDFTARYGGEEFATVLYDVDRVFVDDIAQRMRSEVETLAIPHERSTAAPLLTVSVGAACVRPVPGRHREGLIQLADEALYTAKHQGRNRVVVMEAEYRNLRTGEFREPKKA
ncbi:MAG TPA: diguanylate cyclase [Steroidobacteraceae bacterium]|nr:diguanylate cyclase [Steroidobacteraceae bacterium]